MLDVFLAAGMLDRLPHIVPIPAPSTFTPITYKFAPCLTHNVARQILSVLLGMHLSGC